MKKIWSLLFFIFLVTGIMIGAEEKRKKNTSKIWKDYVKSKKEGTASLVPDFSYAGYYRGERGIPEIKGKVYDVTKFGAVPDDNKDDRDGIQAAVNEASANKGGVVFFPPGKYLLFTDRWNREPILITNDNILLKGSGSTKGGTILFQVHTGLGQADFKLGYTPRVKNYYLIQFQGKAGGTRPHRGAPGGDKLATITKAALRDELEVCVDSVRKLQKNQWVVIRFQSKQAISDFLAGERVYKDWARIREQGIILNEIHQIKEIKKNRLIFYEPLKTGLRKSYQPFISSFDPIENVGVEDICFMGNWLGNFLHHRSTFDDYAWQAINMTYAVNSWVRRCSFINESRGIFLRGCSACSFLELRFGGMENHHGIHTRQGNGVLIGPGSDESHGIWHCISVGYRACGTVFWRFQIHPQRGIDCHSGYPYATLFDRIDGGVMMIGSGGPIIGMPNHAKDLVFWNFNYQRDFKKHLLLPLDFWSKEGRRPYFVKPIFSGLHGRKVVIQKNTILRNESYGKPVEPVSLYEAQVQLRLGKLPAWVSQCKKEWQEYRNKELPAFFDPLKNDNKEYHHYIEEFLVEEMIEELNKIPLSKDNPRVPPVFKVYADKNPGKMRTDFNKVRQTMMNLMSYAYSYSRKKGEIKVYSKNKGGRRYVIFKLTTPVREPGNHYAKHKKNRLKNKYVGEDKAREWDTAQVLAKSIGAQISKKNLPEGSVIFFIVPADILE